jgi:hypothetical protein
MTSLTTLGMHLKRGNDTEKSQFIVTLVVLSHISIKAREYMSRLELR